MCRVNFLMNGDRITSQSLLSGQFLRSTLLLLLLPLNLSAQKFYGDDPITKVPPPMNVENVLSRKLSDYYDFFLQRPVPSRRTAHKNQADSGAGGQHPGRGA